MIELLTVCEWRENEKIDHEAEEPSWPEVERALRAIDAREGCEVYLYPSAANDEEYLVISGSSDRYVVTIAVDEAFLTATQPEEAMGEEALIVGGQEGRFPRRMLLPLQLVLDAARAYFETGRAGGEEGIVWSANE